MSQMSKGQEMLLVSLQRIIDDLQEGMHRVIVIPRTESPLACHIGKKNGDFVADGATWAHFTIIVGDIVDRELEVQIITQSFTDENPNNFGDLDKSDSPQIISGWAVNREGGMVGLKKKELLDVFPYRNDANVAYRGR